MRNESNTWRITRGKKVETGAGSTGRGSSGSWSRYRAGRRHVCGLSTSVGWGLEGGGWGSKSWRSLEKETSSSGIGELGATGATGDNGTLELEEGG